MWVALASPWSAATVGGIVSANLNAPLRMRYGGIRDLVLAASVVLPDGRSIRSGRPVVKNVAGYDLTKLFVGAHGSLGLLIDVSFKLAPLPRARASLVVPAESLSDALASGASLLRVSLVATALLLCQGDLFPALSSPYALVYTVEGLPGDVAAELVQARAVLQAEGVTRLIDAGATSGSEIWADWLARVSAPGDVVVRTGVAPKDLPGLVADQAPGMGNAAFLADLANGMLYSAGIPEAAIRSAALASGGYAVVLSGASTDPWGYAPASLDLMRTLKARWDEHGLFNPGAFIV